MLLLSNLASLLWCALFGISSYMEHYRLSHRLRHLLSCCSVESDHVSYLSSIRTLTPLPELLQAVKQSTESCARRRAGAGGRGFPWIVPGGGLLYTVQLLRQVILTQFQLLCVSVELEQDVEYAFSECRVICEAGEVFNKQLACTAIRQDPKTDSSTAMMGTFHLSFADYAEVLASSHSKRITNQVLHDDGASPDSILRLAKFETGFVRAIVGLFATHTSLMGLKKKVFVSEEMFSITREHPTKWLNCLIPGAQSDELRETGKALVAQVWGRVAAAVVSSSQPLHCETRVGALVARLRLAASQEELEYHRAVTSCLSHTAAAIEQQRALSDWDTGFQALLAAQGADAHRGYRTQNSVKILLTRVLPPLEDQLGGKLVSQSTKLHSVSSMACHIDMLRLSQPLCSALALSTEVATSFLTQGLHTALSKQNLKVLAQLLFSTGPKVSRALARVTSCASHVASPQLSFPLCSWPHTFEGRSCRSYSLAHGGKNQLEEILEVVCVSFHDGWRLQCAETLRTAFPPSKAWRALGKKNSLRQVSPSGYCEAVVSHLLLPVVEAGSVLPEEPQKAFLGLAVCVLVNEMRKTITANRRTYRPSAGRQLLTDCRHLRQWLTSGDLGLHRGTTHLLASLPAMTELEYGLLLICGTAQQRDSPPPPTPLLTPPTPPHLAVFTEQAWHSTQDWTQCIA